MDQKEFHQKVLKRERTYGAIAWLARAVILFAGAAFFQFGWEYAVVDLFKMPSITYLQALILVFMARVLIAFPELGRSHSLQKLHSYQLEGQAYYNRLVLELMEEVRALRKAVEQQNRESNLPPHKTEQEQEPE